MRKARKRVLSTLLAAVLALGLTPSFAFAGEGGAIPPHPMGPLLRAARTFSQTARPSPLRKSSQRMAQR